MALPENRQCRNLFLLGEAIDRAITGKIEYQDRLVVMVHEYSEPEVA